MRKIDTSHHLNPSPGGGLDTQMLTASERHDLGLEETPQAQSKAALRAFKQLPKASQEELLAQVFKSLSTS